MTSKCRCSPSTLRAFGHSQYCVETVKALLAIVADGLSSEGGVAMGVFDSVMVKCPKCGKANEFQSKGGPCGMLTYSLEDAPGDVLSDVNRHAPVKCGGCGAEYSVLYERPRAVEHVRLWKWIACHPKECPAAMKAFHRGESCPEHDPRRCEHPEGRRVTLTEEAAENARRGGEEVSGGDIGCGRCGRVL